MNDNKLFSKKNKTSVFKNGIAEFVNYFSLLDIKGLSSVLKEDVLYDELSKQEWVALFAKQFESFRKNNINHLNPIPGICSGCKKGCSGYTFLDDLSGFYIDFVIEVNEECIIDFTECVSLKNEMKVADKKEQIFINEKGLNTTYDECPF
jgi:hypothetical protein